MGDIIGGSHEEEECQQIKFFSHKPIAIVVTRVIVKVKIKLYEHDHTI